MFFSVSEGERGRERESKREIERGRYYSTAHQFIFIATIISVSLRKWKLSPPFICLTFLKKSFSLSLSLVLFFSFFFCSDLLHSLSFVQTFIILQYCETSINEHEQALIDKRLDHVQRRPKLRNPDELRLKNFALKSKTGIFRC